jgi:hypothetical protein
MNSCGSLPENVGRPWPKERIPIAAPSLQFVASLLAAVDYIYGTGMSANDITSMPNFVTIGHVV